VNYGARQGTLRDPFGHRWFVATALEPDDVPIEDAPGRRFGDIAYVTLEVPSGARARAFYEHVFGWTCDVGHVPDSFHVASITPPSGIHGGQAEPYFEIYFRVDDVEAAADRVRAAGGEVLSIGGSEAGGNAECVDDQGLRFVLFRPRSGY
jgi:predicted enzyme related to lactoylglutathione lyase